MAYDGPFVSRGGLKLDHGLTHFAIDPDGRVCADLGCSTGGFTDVLLQRGAAKVFSVDTGYGVLDWKLRNDDRVVVLERTNAMHIDLPEPVGLVVIDVSWTRQAKILPHAKSLLGEGGEIVTLVKPHYEYDADKLKKTKGVLPAQVLPEVMAAVREDVAAAGLLVVDETESPVTGSRGKNARGNVEILMHLRPVNDAP